MQGVHLRKYGVETKIDFELYEVDGVNFRTDAVDAGSDCSIMKDEGDEATCTNDFVDEGKGYSLTLSSAEMTAARIVVYIVDSATKVWLDKAIVIETYGNASAQHAFDLDTAATTMRGTDNAALASVAGALDDVAADGEVTEADTLMQYLKQLINILIGDPGIVAFPAEAAPTNGVSLAEVIRAIHADVTGLNGSAMIGTNNAATAAKLLAYVQLLARSDEAIATDNATELTAINADGGSGIGDFDVEDDSQEAISDNVGGGVGTATVEKQNTLINLISGGSSGNPPVSEADFKGKYNLKKVKHAAMRK